MQGRISRASLPLQDVSVSSSSIPRDHIGQRDWISREEGDLRAPDRREERERKEGVSCEPELLQFTVGIQTGNAKTYGQQDRDSRDKTSTTRRQVYATFFFAVLCRLRYPRSLVYYIAH